MSTPEFHPFTPGYSKSAVAVPIFALFSTVALLFLAIRSLVLVALASFRGNQDRNKAPEHLFFRTQLGHYAASLIFSNVLISLSGLIAFRWVSESGITTGPLCSAQAALMEIGTVATAYFTISMALHTFNTLALRIHRASWMGFLSCLFGWSFSLLIGLLPLRHGKSGAIYGPRGASCDVRTVYPGLVFSLDAYPVIHGAFFSAILYSLIYLVLRGTLRIKGGFKITLYPMDRRGLVSNKGDEYDNFLSGIARSMLWYPFAFFILLTPYAIVSILAASGRNVPLVGDVVARVCSFMLGLVNVFLLYNTFSALNPIYHSEYSSKSDSNEKRSSNRWSVWCKGSPLPPTTVSFTGLSGPGLPLYRKSEESDKSSSSRNSLTAMVSQRHIIRFSHINNEPPLNQSKRASLQASIGKSFPSESFHQLIAPVAELKRQLAEPSSRLSIVTTSTQGRLSDEVSAMFAPHSLTPAPRLPSAPSLGLASDEDKHIAPALPITPPTDAVSGLPRDSFGVRPLPVLPDVSAFSSPAPSPPKPPKRRRPRPPPPGLIVVPAAPRIAQAEQSPLRPLSSTATLRSSLPIRPLPAVP